MSGPRLYKSAIDCCVQSVRSEGVGCLTRGLNLTLVRAFPVNAATWAAVTWVFRFAEDTNAKEDTYTKLSELKDTSIYLPELSAGSFALSRSFCAEATQAQPSIPPRYRDKETLSRSAMNACNEDSTIFQQLLQSIPGSLYKLR